MACISAKTTWPVWNVQRAAIVALDELPTVATEAEIVSFGPNAVSGCATDLSAATALPSVTPVTANVTAAGAAGGGGGGAFLQATAAPASVATITLQRRG